MRFIFLIIIFTSCASNEEFIPRSEPALLELHDEYLRIGDSLGLDPNPDNLGRPGLFWKDLPGTKRGLYTSAIWIDSAFFVFDSYDIRLYNMIHECIHHYKRWDHCEKCYPKEDEVEKDFWGHVVKLYKN